DMVVRGIPRPQLELTVVGERLDQEVVEVITDPPPLPPCRVVRRGQLVENVSAHPGDRIAGIELGRHLRELAAELVDHTYRDKIDEASVLDELTIVEVAVDHRVPSSPIPGSIRYRGPWRSLT